MFTIKLPLADIIIDIVNQTDFETLLDVGVVDRLEAAYAFLGNASNVTVSGDTAVFQLNVPSQAAKNANCLK